jgi:C1A family cysteine protease
MCWTNNKIHFGYIPEKYYNIGDQELISLLQRGTVAISLSGNNWEDYKGGIFRCNSYDKVNHAVLLVGYTPDYWIVKNQWGRDWG